MGSGDRVKFYRTEAFGIGFSACRFPFSLTFNVHILLWVFSVGLGKAYDE